MKRKHAQPNVESVKENPKNHQFTENGLMLRHPFTMMVAASTGGGKTWLVKNLLENRQQWISFSVDKWYRVCERNPSKH